MVCKTPLFRNTIDRIRIGGYLLERGLRSGLGVSELLQLATNSVDSGPYFCCPVWSTYGAAWRPATPFYNYVPPVPANWPDVAKMTANWPAAAVSVPVKARKPTKNDEEDQLPDGISSSINSWVQRQKL
ncbi:hypothetical protein CAEBREN_10788 [Caenorhabditis brenneri]|uniref:Uncharacterized protein n=1 Tax=Caenorhabditis brenneri TaxID=135651 RepID=G0N436_CAEBE|nr:hypothetical protein CAEBREN_10788 [Caenorhabditis brenneri]